MSIYRTTALAVIAAACLSPMAHAENRDRVSMRVHHADLNLTRAADRARFDRRVSRAADIVCIAQGSDWRMRKDVARCRAEMHADASNQVAAIAARSTPVMLASAERRR